IHVEGGLLTAVRMAQNQSGIVRVVLDVNGVKDYTATLLNSPAQLVIDLYPDSRAAVVRAAKAKRGSARGTMEEPTTDAVALREERAGVQSVSTISTGAATDPVGPQPVAAGAASGSMPV